MAKPQFKHISVRISSFISSNSLRRINTAVGGPGEPAVRDRSQRSQSVAKRYERIEMKDAIAEFKWRGTEEDAEVDLAGMVRE